MAVVLPTWLLLCWDRFTHSILVQGFLPEVFRKRKASESNRYHSFFLLVYNFQSSKRLLRNRVFSHLSSSADFRKPFEDLSHKNRKTRGVKPIWFPPPYLCVKPSRQWDQKFSRSLKPVRSHQTAVAKVQNQSNPKGNRGISLAAQRVSLSAPLHVAWFPSAAWELSPHLPPCLAKDRTKQIHRICR